MHRRIIQPLASCARLLAAAASVALPAATLSGCGANPDAPPGWELVLRNDLTEANTALLDSAEAARNGLARGLVHELTAAIQSGGHVAAIGICQERAPIIAKEVSLEHGVRVGRTSANLRQPGNQAPAWAQSQLAGSTTEAIFVQGESNLRALFPIVIAPVCLACHGKEADLAIGVPDALSQSYPSDRAVGYEDGDLRGWFWVEAGAN